MLLRRWLQRGALRHDEGSLTVHLEVAGELSSNPDPMPYSWTTADGVTVSVHGKSVQIRWPVAPDASSESFEHMTSEVERVVLVESLETIAPVSVSWTAHREVGVLGGATLYAPALAQSWTSRRSRHPLDQNNSKAAVLAQCPEIVAAAGQFRMAMEAWRGDAAESMARLYLASEGLVLSLRGDTGRSHWAGFGTDTGFGGDDALRVFFSLQFGRHVNVTQATTELAKMGVAPLTPGECLNEVARLIESCIAYRLTHPC